MRGLFKKCGSIIAGSFQIAPQVLWMALLVVSFDLLSEIDSQGFNSDIPWRFVGNVRLRGIFPQFGSQPFSDLFPFSLAHLLGSQFGLGIAVP